MKNEIVSFFQRIQKKPLDAFFLLLVILAGYPLWSFIRLEPEKQFDYFLKIVLFAILWAGIGAFFYYLNKEINDRYPDTTYIPVYKDGIRFFTETAKLPIKGHDPCWSNKGDQIVYLVTDENDPNRTWIYRWSQFGQKEMLLSSNSEKFAPSFSHDDRYVAFISQNKLFVFEPGKTYRARQISPDGYVLSGGDASSYPSPWLYHWSPTQPQIVCGLRKTNQHSTRLYIINVNETGSNYDIAECNFFSNISLGSGELYIRWSPSGRRIAFLFGREGVYNFWISGEDRCRFRLVASRDIFSGYLNSDDEKQVKRYPCIMSGFDWLSENTLVFSYGNNGTRAIASYDLKNGFKGKTPLVNYQNPVSCQKKKRLFYLNFLPASALTGHLMNFENGCKMPLFELTPVSSAANLDRLAIFSKDGKRLLMNVNNAFYLLKLPPSIKTHLRSFSKKLVYFPEFHHGFRNHTNSISTGNGENVSET